MRKRTYRSVVDDLWWYVRDVFETDKYDLPDDLLIQAENFLNSLDFGDQLLVVELMRCMVLNNVPMLDCELLASSKAEERAKA